jgi:VWFA-related protein
VSTFNAKPRAAGPPSWQWRRALALAVLAFAAVPDAQQPSPQRAPGTLTEGVTAVLVDAVVRDRRGQPVRDLTETDFQILEDGVPQKLGSFTPVMDQGKAAPAADPGVTAKPAAAAGSIDKGPVVTALVFDRLSPEARTLAVQAAQSYLGSKDEIDQYFGIFGVDLALAPYAPFTRNVRVLRQALERVSARASASFNSPEQQQQKANADQQAAAAGQQAAAAIAAAGPGGSAGASAKGDALLAQMASDMISDFHAMERDQQGYGTTNGLLAIIKSMAKLPGRKSLVLFSEGLAIPPAVHRHFTGVIDAANRANVSIYAMDAKGLRPESEQAKIRDEVNRAAGAGGGILAGAAGNNPLSKSLETNEDVLRQDPRYGLGTLAQDTGGLLFDSSNNLRQWFDRIENDLRNYYMLGYTPSNEAYDGRFRTIEVKVNRPGVTVAARKGYFAVRDPGGASIDAWEAPALGALEQKPVPNAFPFRAAALLFPERERPGLVPVVVELKTAPITFATAADGQSYSSDFTILVRFLDAQNRVVRKVSQHYEVRGPLTELARAKAGEVIFYREPELPPGVYAMESVVHDAPSGKSSVRFSTLEVPRSETAGLRLSSLVLVKRGDPVPEKERRADNPLLVNGIALAPNLGDAVSKSARELGFYFAIYPARQGPGPSVTIQLVQNGTVAVQLPMPVPDADRSGRIQQLGRLPLADLAAGSYELRAIVKQGTEQVTRSAQLRIVE